MTVTGGMDEANPFAYRWTVANHGEPPITFFEIAHFRGLVFVVPEGWTYETTERAEYDKPVKVGRFTASTAAGKGIRDGQAGGFGVNIAARGATLRVGTATIGFADGRKIEVTGVEYPGTASPLDTFLAPVGLGLLLALILAIQAARSRRRRAGRQSDVNPMTAS